MFSKLKEAVDQKTEQVVMHHEFEAALDLNSISTWKKLAEEWEMDPTKQNPYERQGEG